MDGWAGWEGWASGHGDRGRRPGRPGRVKGGDEGGEATINRSRWTEARNRGLVKRAAQNVDIFRDLQSLRVWDARTVGWVDGYGCASSGQGAIDG